MKLEEALKEASGSQYLRTIAALRKSKSVSAIHRHALEAALASHMVKARTRAILAEWKQPEESQQSSRRGNRLGQRRATPDGSKGAEAEERAKRYPKPESSHASSSSHGVTDDAGHAARRSGDTKPLGTPQRRKHESHEVPGGQRATSSRDKSSEPKCGQTLQSLVQPAPSEVEEPSPFVEVVAQQDNVETLPADPTEADQAAGKDDGSFTSVHAQPEALPDFPPALQGPQPRRDSDAEFEADDPPEQPAASPGETSAVFEASDAGLPQAPGEAAVEAPGALQPLEEDGGQQPLNASEDHFESSAAEQVEHALPPSTVAAISPEVETLPGSSPEVAPESMPAPSSDLESTCNKHMDDTMAFEEDSAAEQQEAESTVEDAKKGHMDYTETFEEDPLEATPELGAAAADDDDGFEPETPQGGQKPILLTSTAEEDEFEAD